MRLLLAFAVAILPAAASAQTAPPMKGAPTKSAECPRTTSYLADKSGLYRGPQPTPKKLTELPPAISYMAVYRTIGGCEVPLTMVDYRNPRRR